MVINYRKDFLSQSIYYTYFEIVLAHVPFSQYQSISYHSEPGICERNQDFSGLV